MSSQSISIYKKPGPTLGSSGKVPFGWTSSSCPPAGTYASVQRDRLFSLGSSQILWSHPSFVVIATLWITKDIGFYQTSISIWLFMASTRWQWITVFPTKRILVCSATPHFSTHSSFMILMRVFFQETHISLFDLGASVRIFLILLWHSESVNVFHICLMLFRDIYDHLLVTQGKVCRNFF